MMAKSPTIVRLQLDIEAKKALDDLCDKRGMTQIATLSRLVSWFGRQDEVVQASVLGLMSDDTLRGLAEIMLARANARVDPKVAAEQSAGRRR